MTTWPMKVRMGKMSRRATNAGGVPAISRGLRSAATIPPEHGITMSRTPEGNAVKYFETIRTGGYVNWRT